MLTKSVYRLVFIDIRIVIFTLFRPLVYLGQ